MNIKRGIEAIPHIKDWYGVVLVLVIALFIIIFLSQIAELGEIGRLLKQVHILWFIIAFIAQFLAFLLLGDLYKSIVTFGKKRVHIKYLWYFFKVSVAMVFVDYAIPSFTASSNLLLYYSTRKHAVKKERASLVLTYNVFLNLLFFFLIFITALVYLLLTGKYQRALLWPTILFVIFFILINRILWTKNGMNRFKFVISKLFIKWPHLKKRIFGVIADFHKAKIRVGNKDISLFVFYTLVSYILKIATVGFIFLAFGYPVNLGVLIIGYALALILSNLSYIKVGVFEGSMAFGYTLMGVPLTLAVAVTLLYRVVSFWIPFVIGFILFRGLIKAKPLE